MHILFLSRWYPYPPDNGSKLRIFNLLRGLSPHHDISLISFFDPSESFPDTNNLSGFCRNIEIVQYKPFQPLGIRALIGLFSSKPRSVMDTFSPEVQDKIMLELSTNDFDLVIASQFDMAIYSELFHTLPAIFDEVEVGVLYEKYTYAKSPVKKIRNGMTWEKHRRFLGKLLSGYRACTVVSNEEAELLKFAVPNYRAIEIIPNFLNLSDYTKVEETPITNQIIFTGSFSYYPNYEAMNWFIRKVFPLILSQNPDVQLIITGDPADKTLPINNNVSHVGFVEDVRIYIKQSQVSIVPLHIGGGSRLKILEAMALGTPVVATSKGAEGLEVCQDTHLLIANEPEKFAHSVIEVLKDQILSKKLADNAYQLVKDKYSSEDIIPKYLKFVETTLSEYG